MHNKKYRNIEFVVIIIALLLSVINFFIDREQVEASFFYALFSGHLAIVAVYCMVFFSRKKNYLYRRSKYFWVLPIKPSSYVLSDFKFIVSKFSFYLLNIISIVSLFYYLENLSIFKMIAFIGCYFCYSFTIVFICVIAKFIYERKQFVHTSIYAISMILLSPLFLNEFLPNDFYFYYPFTSLAAFFFEEPTMVLSVLIGVMIGFYFSVFYIFKKVTKNWLV